MRQYYIREILLKCFDLNLVCFATGWDEEPNPQPEFPTFDFHHQEHDDWNQKELLGVQVFFEALSLLDEKSLKLKFNAIKDISYGAKVKFPANLDQDDMIYWARKPRWSRAECNLLSIGLKPANPAPIDFDNIYKFDSSAVPPIAEYFERHDLFNDAVMVGNVELDDDIYKNDFPPFYDVYPLSFLLWAQKMEFSLPDGLFEMVSRIQGDESLDSPYSDEPEIEINPKERSSYLTLIHSMGNARQFRYDPQDSRNGAVVRIGNAIADAGLNMSDKTIKKYMKEAAEEAERLKDKKN